MQVVQNKSLLYKVSMAFPLFMLYLLYFIITLEKRSEYLMGEQKGCNCIGSKDTSWFIPGLETTFYYNRAEKPVKMYLTWRQWWSLFGYSN